MAPIHNCSLQAGYHALQMSEGTECVVALLFPAPPPVLSSPCLYGIAVASQRAVGECWEEQKVTLMFTIVTCAINIRNPFKRGAASISQRFMSSGDMNLTADTLQRPIFPVTSTSQDRVPHHQNVAPPLYSHHQKEVSDKSYSIRFLVLDHSLLKFPHERLRHPRLKQETPPSVHTSVQNTPNLSRLQNGARCTR